MANGILFAMSSKSNESGALREPRQARSRERLERIMKATAMLLRERRFDQVTIADIVKEAGTSVGVFYSRFENKDALLEFLEEQVYAEVGEVIANNLEGQTTESPEELVRKLVELTVLVHKKFSGISREIVQMAWGDPARLARTVAWSEQLAGSLRPMLSPIADPKLHADADKAADFAILLMLGTVREMIPGKFWPRKIRPTHKQVIDELSGAVLRYLRG